jgi:hypothetical protein
MKGRRMTNPMESNEHTTGVEWVGGIAFMPVYVTGEGEPYRPEALLWIGAEGAVLGSTVVKPGQALGLACESLQSAMKRPMYGRAHAPARVRVASPELAEVLCAGHHSIAIVCAPTPELDEVLAAMRETMCKGAETEFSYLSSMTGPEAIAAFFRAAAGLFRARPWEIAPGDRSPLSVTIEALGLRDAPLSVMGQMGESLGLVLFPDIEHYDAFLDAADALERGEKPLMPPHLSLNFEPGAKLDAALRKEIARYGWEVAGADAYPRLLALDEDMIARPLTARDFTVAEAVALALPGFLADRNALRAAFEGGEPLCRTFTVSARSGRLEVVLRAPHELDTTRYRPPYDVLAGLRALARKEELSESEEREDLERELLRRFARSPEAKALTDVQACRFVMDYAAGYLGRTIATLDPAGLREVVFEIIPRKLSTEPSSAGWIIEQNRAFYAFLKREHALKQADACLGVLGGDAVQKLEAALSDPRNFGMAKSLVTAGREAGYDVQTREGLEEWMRVVQSRPLPDSIRLPSFDLPAVPPPRAADRASARAKKNRRKAARRSRKKNR